MQVFIGHYDNTYNAFTYNDNTFSPTIQLASFFITFITVLSKIIYK